MWYIGVSGSDIFDLCDGTEFLLLYADGIFSCIFLCIFPVFPEMLPGISEINRCSDVLANQTAQRQADSLYTFHEIAPT